MTDMREIPLMHFGTSPLFSEDGSKKIKKFEENAISKLTHGLFALRQNLGLSDGVKATYGNLKQLVQSEFGMESLEEQRAANKPIADNQLKTNRISFLTALTSLAKNLGVKEAAPINSLIFDLVGHSNTYRWDHENEASIREANNDLTRLTDTLNKQYHTHVPMEYVRDTVLRSPEMENFRMALREMRVEARTYGTAERIFSSVEKDSKLKSGIQTLLDSYAELENLLLLGDPNLSQDLGHTKKQG